MKTAVVIGAGIGGLAGAIRLRIAGLEVSVFESNSHAGGKLHSFEQAGFRFDAGPSLFTLPHLVDELFTLAGKNPKDYFNYSQKEIACNYFWEDETKFSAYFDRKKLAEEIERSFDVSAHPALRHLERSKFIHDSTAKIFLEKSLHKKKTWLSKDVLDSLLKVHKLGLGNSMHELNKKKLNHEKLVQVFDRYATYNGSNPYSAPGILNVIPHLEQGIGTFFPKGGMVSITNSLVKLAKELGVDLHFNSKIDKIKVQNGKAQGVILKGKEIRADMVLCNSDIVPAYRKLLKDQKQPEKTLNRERSSSALIFYWGVEHKSPELELHNILFSDDYENEFEALFKRKTIPDDPTIYINISSKLESTDAPNGCENWFVMVNAPANYGQNWGELIAKTKKQVKMKISRMLNFNFPEKILTEAILTPEDIERKTSSYRGALYGAASNDKMAAFLRHPNFSKKISGLFFCGGSVHPGGGIPLCLLSAKIAVKLATENR